MMQAAASRIDGSTGMGDDEQVKLAAEAYIYGYPLVYDLKEVANGVEGGGSLPCRRPITASPTPAGC